MALVYVRECNKQSVLIALKRLYCKNKRFFSLHERSRALAYAPWRSLVLGIFVTASALVHITVQTQVGLVGRLRSKASPY